MTGRRNQPEWTCETCGFSNWAVRKVCRQCKGHAQNGAHEEPRRQSRGGQGKGSGKTQFAPRALPVSAWERGPPRDPVAALEQVAAAARRVGAQAASALTEEARAARHAAVAAKPVHVRMGRVQDRLEVALAKQKEAEAALEVAMARAQQAASHTQTVREELAAVEAEVGKAVAPASGDAVTKSLRELLAVLESSNVLGSQACAHPSPSQLKLMEVMQACHASVGISAAVEEDFADMEEALEAAEPRQQVDVWEQSLRSAAASAQSDAEFGAMARAALVQRGAPY